MSKQSLSRLNDWQAVCFLIPEGSSPAAGAADWLACRGYVSWQTGCRDWQPCLQCWLADDWGDPTAAAEELQWPHAREHSIYGHGESISSSPEKIRSKNLLLEGVKCFLPLLRNPLCFQRRRCQNFNWTKWDNRGDDLSVTGFSDFAPEWHSGSCLAVATGTVLTVTDPECNRSECVYGLVPTNPKSPSLTLQQVNQRRVDRCKNNSGSNNNNNNSNDQWRFRIHAAL